MSRALDPLYFLLAFPLFWFAVTMFLSLSSGWFGLMKKYPNRPDNAVAVFPNHSLGVVSMRNIFKLSVCPTGLTIGIMRIVAPPSVGISLFLASML
jgi:hypothetical protein